MSRTCIRNVYLWGIVLLVVLVYGLSVYRLYQIDNQLTLIKGKEIEIVEAIINNTDLRYMCMNDKVVFIERGKYPILLDIPCIEDKNETIN